MSLSHPAGQETITILEAPASSFLGESRVGNSTDFPALYLQGLWLTPGTEVKLLTAGNGFLLLSFKLQGKEPTTVNNTNAYVQLKKLPKNTKEYTKI